EERVLLLRAGRDDPVGRDHPDRDALAPAGVEVAGVAQGQRAVGCVQGSDVLVRQPASRPDEHLPQRPVAHAGTSPRTSARLASYADAASRTHAPRSWAPTRWAIRWRLSGPSPRITSYSSEKSISPKS